MKLFLDTADVSEIEKASLWGGVIEGITTNQTKFVGVNTDLETTVRQIVEKSTGPVSVELTTKKPTDLIEEAKRYHSWDPKRIVVKVAMSADGVGVETIAALSQMGIPVNATVMMNYMQAYLAAMAGARYVSLFYNRAKESGLDPQVEISKTREFLEEKQLSAEIIAGSIRTAEDVTKAFDSGAHIATITYKVLASLPYHPTSERTISEFDLAWEKYQTSQKPSKK